MVAMIKATSITHSSKEASEASVSCLLFCSRQARAMLKRLRKNDPAILLCPGGGRPRACGIAWKSALASIGPYFLLLPGIP